MTVVSMPFVPILPGAMFVSANLVTAAMEQLAMVYIYPTETRVILLMLNEFSSDIDECTTGTDNCDARAVCTNTVGSFTCVCQTGYIGNGVTCSGMCM